MDHIRCTFIHIRGYFVALTLDVNAGCVDVGRDLLLEVNIVDVE